MLLAVLTLPLATTTPYPSSARPADTLFVLSSKQRSPAELLCLDSLAGLLARSTPRLYRVTDETWKTSASDSYAAWLRQMQRSGVAVNSSLLNSSAPSIVSAFANEAQVRGYILADGSTRCQDSDDARLLALEGSAWCGSASGRWLWESADSVSAALTLAAALDGLLVVADATLAAALDAVGIPQHTDASNLSVGDVLKMAGVLDALSRDVYVFQDASKSQFLGDYATFARAATLPFGSEPSAQDTLLQARGTSGARLGAAFGWGPENSYVSTCNAHAVYVHASDYCINLAALSNAPPSSLPTPNPLTTHGLAHGHDLALAHAPSMAARSAAARAPPTTDNHTRASSQRHTVAFVMTDGDNLQWALGPLTTDQRWWGSSQRGAVPVGWTLSPGIAYVAPPALELIAANRSSADELVAGPSGVGYTFPQTWPAASRSSFAALTADGMRRSSMELVNVLGQNDDPPDDTALAPLLNESTVAGCLYYAWGGGYSALEGRAWRHSESGKLVISGRYSLWGDGTSGTTLGVQALTAALLAMSRDASSVDGYSIVPVHVWTHSYADVLAVAKALQADGGVDVVLPSELLRRIETNVWSPKATCGCDTPGAGTSGHNRYTCDDGTAGYCASDETCFTGMSFVKGDWRSGCRK